MTVIVRSIPWLTVRYGTRVARRPLMRDRQRFFVLRVALVVVAVAHRGLGPQLLGQHLDRFGPAPCYLVRPGQILACRSSM